MHDCRDHIHNDWGMDNLNKDTMNLKLNDLNQFKGFDDFMYFSYKYWPLIKSDPENIDKAKNIFTDLAKKFNKLKVHENYTIAAEKYTVHLDDITNLIFTEGDVHKATVNIGKYIKPFTIQDKFIRNFNKKLASSEV